MREGGREGGEKGGTHHALIRERSSYSTLLLYTQTLPNKVCIYYTVSFTVMRVVMIMKDCSRERGRP